MGRDYQMSVGIIGKLPAGDGAAGVAADPSAAAAVSMSTYVGPRSGVVCLPDGVTPR